MLEVRTTSEDITEDLQLIPWPDWWQNPVFWGLAALGLALLTGLVLLLIRRVNRSQPATPPAATTGPVHDAFLQRLSQLRQRLDQLSAYELAIEVSGIIRDFLEAQFRLRVPFQTTRECLSASETRRHLSPTQQGTLAQFLRQCDTVKFARQDAARSESVAMLDTAEGFIRDCVGLSSQPETSATKPVS